MKCERCGKEHDGIFGSGRFCSLKCANTRKHTNETKRKLSEKQRIFEKKFCKVCGKKLNYRSKTSLCKEHLYGEKKCSDCGTLLTEENAYKKRDRLQSYCKKCLLKRQKERWIERKKWAIEYKGGKCVICGYNKYYGALDFHHLNPKEKELNWNKMRFTNIETIKRELNKCVLLCSNCHREIHGGVEQLDGSTVF